MTIHVTALVSASAVLGENVSVGPYSIIHDYVTIGRGSKIGAYCEIGAPTPLSANPSLTIGDNANIRSHSVIYAGSIIGKNFLTGHHVCVRENTLLEDSVQLGSRGDIQGDCTIGAHTKMHANVHVGKFSTIGRFAWLFPDVLLTNDPMPPSDVLLGPHIGDFCVIASKTLIFPGIRISNDAVIGAASVVRCDIPAGMVASGNPAKVICPSNILRMPNNPKQRAYPWRFRFHRNYPKDEVENWIHEAVKLNGKE